MNTDKIWKGLTALVALMLLCVLWVVAKQSSDIAELATTIEEDGRYVKGLEAELKRKDEALGIKLQNSELERDRVDRLMSDQIANTLQSLDNLATGVRELHQGLAEHRQGHEDLAKSREVLKLATEKVGEVEEAVRTLIAALEASRQAAAGVGTGNVTVLSSPEDEVLSAFEVAALVDRLDKEMKVLEEQLAEARLLEKEIREHQQAEEAEEGDR